jgi:hypothetical protein
MVNKKVNLCHLLVADILEESNDSYEGRHRSISKRKENNAKKFSRLYIVPHRTILTKAQEETAKRMTERTQKGSELFVKILTALNTGTLRNCVLVCKNFSFVTITIISKGRNSTEILHLVVLCTRIYHVVLHAKFFKTRRGRLLWQLLIWRREARDVLLTATRIEMQDS